MDEKTQNLPAGPLRREASRQEKQESVKNKKLHVEYVRQLVTLSTSGFGLVAALAWNNVIQEFVNEYVKKFLPKGSGFTSLILYALLITLLAVFVTAQLSKLLQNLEEK